MKKKLSFLLLIGIMVHAVFPIYAQQSDLPDVNIAPGSFYYPFKRFSEKIKINFYFTSDSKINYYKELVQNRLAELNYVINKDYLDQVEQSTQRISYQVGILTDYVVAKKLINKKDVLIKLFKDDKIILEKLRDKYPANSNFWMLVSHSINSIDLNLQKL